MLSRTQRIGISELALLGRINHQRCLVNVEWMERHGFVRIEVKELRKEVVVTEAGWIYIMKLAALPLPLDVTDQFQESGTQLLAAKSSYKM